MRLIEIGDNGKLSEDVERNDFLREVIQATVGHYRRTGFVPPWTGYVGLDDGVPVGVCGYKSKPVDGRVEIAYGTAPAHEGKGVATALASELVKLARGENASLAVFAQTLPEENASTSILKKLGFQMMRTVDHPEDGLVWEWELPTDIPLPRSESAAELAVDAEVRTTPPKDFTASPIPKAVSHDPRLPTPGTSIVRQYKGREIEVRVLKNGFEWEGDRYQSLSAVAKAVTGSHCNGFRFFNLEAK